jgi:putative endonuclease
MNTLIAEARRMAPSRSRGMSMVYFLRLESGIIYIGASTDFLQRLDDHRSGQACRTTYLDRPAAVLRVEIHATFTEARTREAQLIRWSRSKKEALVRGDLGGLRALSKSREENRPAS